MYTSLGCKENKLRHVRTVLALGKNAKLLAIVTIIIIFVIVTWLHIYTPGALRALVTLGQDSKVITGE